MDCTHSSASAIARFRKLHESNCFVLPNPWDRGSARFLESLGFQALATTSAGLSFARALPDEIGSLSADDVLEHFRDLVSSTTLPLNADFQNGYGHTLEELAANVKRCIETGVAGFSIEDASGESGQPLYDRDHAIERVKTARAVLEDCASDVVLTARCEAWLVGDPEPFRSSLDRLVAYAEAGADCLFAPGVRDEQEIAEIVRVVAPKPVNVLVSSPVPGLSVARLADLGVRRISLGSALSRVAWKAFMQAARSIFEFGTFDCFANAASFDELNNVFSGSLKR